jgi:CheY-like chemotaxis protein
MAKSKNLVADDEPAIAKMLKLILERKGYEVDIVSNGKEALERLKMAPFDCLVTDAIMPVLSGFDLTRAIRNDPKDGSIPVVMLTRKRHRVDVKQALDAGVNDYVIKPIDEQLLLDKIEACLKKAKQERHVVSVSMIKEADLLVGSEITALSESGVTLLTPLELPNDFSCESRSPVFAEIGIQAPLMKLLSCVPLGKARGNLAFEAKFSFAGVTESDLKKIRIWLQKEAIRRRK